MDNNKLVYIWDTSIPENWKKIAGSEYFVHISKSNKPKNTLEFMVETQRYINKIRSQAIEPIQTTVDKPVKQVQDNLKASVSKPNLLHKSQSSKLTESNSALRIERPKLSNREIPKLPEIRLVNKNRSSIQFNDTTQDILGYYNKNSGYTKLNHLKHPEYIFLGNALKANSNRVLNSFSPKRNQSISYLKFL